MRINFCNEPDVLGPGIRLTCRTKFKQLSQVFCSRDRMVSEEMEISYLMSSGSFSRLLMMAEIFIQPITYYCFGI